MSDSTQTVRLHRVLRAPGERIYRAFVEPGAYERWLPPFGFVGKVHEMNAVVGGRYRMTFTNFGANQSHSFGGTYLELEPGRRIAYEASFDAPELPGTMKTTVVLTPVSCGTDVSITQEGIPPMIPAEMCYLGWQESLVSLAQLVEPNIPG
ncbi:conserved hypothetical protein [Burkholderiales bacterium 8X]|nr:conserved hypothetical protein [Burkholderiales bacterium 8X]